MFRSELGLRNEKANLELIVQSRDKEIANLKSQIAQTQSDLDHANRGIEEQEKSIDQLRDQVRQAKLQVEEAQNKVKTVVAPAYLLHGQKYLMLSSPFVDQYESNTRNSWPSLNHYILQVILML